MARFLQEPSKNGAAQIIGSAAEIDEWCVSYPGVWEHLSETSWESGAPRVTSTITVFVEEGLVKICLRDRALFKTAWVSGRSILKALGALETGLEAGSLEWRKDRATKR